MLRFYLIRHGQDEDNANGILNGHRDRPLTAIGIEQAHQIATKIKDTGIAFDAVYSSPLQRARKTAEIITDELQLPQPTILPALIERDFGDMSGKSYAEAIAMSGKDILRTDTITYVLGAETFPELINRADTLLSDLSAKHQDGNLLLVTHGDIGKMIYAAYYHLPWKEVLALFHFGNSDLLELSKDSSPEIAHIHKVKQHNL